MSKKNGKSIKCKECGTGFYLSQSRFLCSQNRTVKFCSMFCRRLNEQKHKVQKACLVCKKIFGVRPAFKKQRYCSQKCYFNAIRGIPRKNPPDYSVSSRVIKWRDQVLKRDNYQCVECGECLRPLLQAHHVVYKSKDSEQRFNVANGRTLCVDCHAETHAGDGFANLILSKKRTA